MAVLPDRQRRGHGRPVDHLIDHLIERVVDAVPESLGMVLARDAVELMQ
jgi:hypothetical protein